MPSLFREKHDLFPVAAISSGLLFSLIAALTYPNRLAIILGIAGIGLRILVPVHQHYHAHLSVFRLQALNSAYDFLLSLAGGNLTTLWKIHHCIGHHCDYLDPRRDLEGNLRFGKNIPFRRVIFTVLGDALTLPDSLRLLRSLSGSRRSALGRSLGWELMLQLSALALLLYLNPAGSLLWIVLPNIVLRWMVFWFSFAQHEGMPMKDVYSSSTTNFRANHILLNVGLHTAHHERPGLHWSRLPARTREILPLIPAQCLRGNKFNA